MPLTEKFAVTGAANLVTSTATGTVDALGVAFFPGRGALVRERNTYAALAPVGNNPEMPINLSRQALCDCRLGPINRLAIQSAI
jgi:hypothetical protein